MIGYVTKDLDGALYFHYNMPERDDENEWWWSDTNSFNLVGDFKEFDTLTYYDDPVKVEFNMKRI